MTPQFFDMRILGEGLKGLDRGLAVEAHMQAVMVVVVKPAGKGFFNVLLS